MQRGGAIQSDLVNAFRLLDDDGYVWLKGNVHTHTTNSDGRVAPQDRLDQYVAKGYEFLCLSDHYTITPVDTVKPPDDFVLIQGAELHPESPFGGREYHLVCLNVHEDMDSEAMSPQDVLDNVNDQGGKVWLGHPHFCAVNVIRDVMPLRGFAGIEVFNTATRCAGRGEASVHWDDWMDLANRLLPAIGNDDAHGREEENHDTYGGWTMVRVKERTVEAVMDALTTGASYVSTGPQILDIALQRVGADEADLKQFQATIRCSEARRVLAITNHIGAECYDQGRMFDQCTMDLRPTNQWVRFEIIGPDGDKAWSNPFDLSAL